jgi:cyclopropane fatty-acyl-phospholipid synthase-like methyltransferase
MITAAKVHGAHGWGDLERGATEPITGSGLDNQVTFGLCDYRTLAPRGEKFHHIISVGMFEHVGRSQHATHYNAVARMPGEGGVSVLHHLQRGGRTHGLHLPGRPCSFDT